MLLCSCISLQHSTPLRWKIACCIACLASCLASLHSSHAILCIPYCIGFGISAINIRFGPWGARDSRFWCDVRSMLSGGYDIVYAVSYVCFVSLSLAYILYHVEAPITLCVMTACFCGAVLTYRERHMFYLPPKMEDPILTFHDYQSVERDVSVNAIILSVLGCAVVTGCSVAYIASHPHHKLPFGLAYVIVINEMWGPFVIYKTVQSGLKASITRELVSSIFILFLMVSLRLTEI